METSAKNIKKHIGRNISRIREIRGIKQDFLASALGVSQQTISKIEQNEDVENSTLEKIAEVLGLTTDAIKNFNEEAIFNIIGNTYNDYATSLNYQCSFNPIEKVIELYERLLASEREKIEILSKK